MASFNTNYAGTKAPNGATIPAYVLPTHYQLGEPTYNHDFRATKNFAYNEKYRLGIFGEVFNAFNIANLRGYGSTLDIRARIRPHRHSPSVSRPSARSRPSVPPAPEPFKWVGASVLNASKVIEEVDKAGDQVSSAHRLCYRSRRACMWNIGLSVGDCLRFP